MSQRDAIQAWGAGVSPEIMMDLLTPHLADITAVGLSLTGDVTAEELGLTEADPQLDGALAVGLDLARFERTICVTGVVEGTAIRECVRCLRRNSPPHLLHLPDQVASSFCCNTTTPQTSLRGIRCNVIAMC